MQVVRCFEDDDIVHVSGKVDPLDDIDVINLELALADLAQIEKRLERLKKGECVVLLSAVLTSLWHICSDVFGAMQ